MPKFTRKEKLEMIRAYTEEKKSVTRISKEYEISVTALRELLALHERGEDEKIGMGKKGMTFRSYPGAFKIKVIQDKTENHLGYRETGRKYGIKHTLVMLWERIYLEKGEKGLLKDRRGEIVKEGCPTKGRPRKKPVDKDMIAELQQLRLENEYLKKLYALVQEKGKLPPKTGHE